MAEAERALVPDPGLPGGTDIVGRHGRLVGRTALISSFTALSRVLGFVREFLAALVFGDRSVVYDAFVTAWRVPNLFRRLLGEGAVATALQTALTETDGDQGEAAGRRLFHDVMRLSLGLLVTVCLFAMGLVWLLPDRMPLTGWAWLGPEPAVLRDLALRVMPYVVFVCLSGLAGGALAVRGRFVGASAASAVMNVVTIATLVAVGLVHGWSGPSPEDGALGLERHLEMARMFAWGLLLAGLAQLLVLGPDLVRSGLALGGATVRATRSAGAVLASSAPLALGAAVYQVNVMLDGFMAQSLLERGGATTYYLANRVQQFPLALVATAATSAVFPALKALGHTGRLAELRALHERTHLAVLFLALPATAGILALAPEIAAALFEHGQFSAEGTARTAAGLRSLALALVPAGAAGLIGRTYFALGDFKTPVRVSLWMMGLNLGLNTLLLVGLGLDVEGLGLSTALVSWTNVAVLMPGLLRRLPPAPVAIAWGPRVARLLGVSAASGLAALATQRATAETLGEPLALIVAILLAATLYVILSALLRSPELEHVRARFSRRR